MGKKKQRENAREFLRPAKRRLSEPWASVFDMVYRGKQRGDGLMVDVSDETEQKVKTIINEHYEHAVEQTNEEFGVTADGIAPTASPQDIDDWEGYKQTYRDKLMSMLTDHEQNQAYAVYIANEIETEKRGSYISAKNMMSRLDKAIDTKKASWAADLFRSLANDPEADVRKPENISKQDTHRPLLQSRDDQMDRLKQKYRFYHREMLA